jgi:hypothetical protein
MMYAMITTRRKLVLLQNDLQDCGKIMRGLIHLIASRNILGATGKALVIITPK